MKILVLGDVHGNETVLDETIRCHPSDVVLQVGDLGVCKSFTKPFFFVSGNHEDFEAMEKMRIGERKCENLVAIRTGEVVKVGGLVIVGLSGIYAPSKLYKQKKDLTPVDRVKYFGYSDIQRLLKMHNVDVFISHEAPSESGFIWKDKDYGVKPVRDVIVSMKPKIAITGHLHVYQKHYIGETIVYGLDRIDRECYYLNTKDLTLTRNIKMLGTGPFSY